jgi:hypothetical protein
VVENPGETLHAEAHRPVNAPEPVRVETGPADIPLAVRLPARQIVVAIEDKWRIDDEWWRAEPVSRLYFMVRLASGQRLVLYKDLVTGGWYRQSY